MISFHIPISGKKVRVVLYKPAGREQFNARWSFRGKPHHHATGFDTEREARQRARELVETLSVEGRSAAPLSSLIKTYMDARPDSQAARGVERRLKKFQESAGDIRICSMDAGELSGLVQRYLDARTLSGLAPLSVKSDQGALAMFCGFLRRGRHAQWPVNPAGAEFVRTPRVPKRMPTSPDRATVLRVLRAVGDHPIRAVIVLCLSGVRPASAIQRVEWQHIDFENRRVRTFEKDVERDVSLGKWALEELTRVAKQRGLVWPYNYFTAFDCVRRFATEAKAPDFSLQSCRRAFTNTLEDEGASVQDESELAGHSIQVAQKHYRRARSGQLQHVADLIDFRDTCHESGQAKSEPDWIDDIQTK